MSKVVLCKDGIEAHLERDDGLWLVLRDPGDGVRGRFAIDPSELRAVQEGTLAFQATDGEGASVSIEGTEENLKIRLEVAGKGAKQCRIPSKNVKEALETLDQDV